MCSYRPPPEGARKGGSHAASYGESLGLKTKAQRVWGVIFAVAMGISILVFSIREAVLQEAGKFMAPQTAWTDGTADVVILEGTEFISRTTVSKGANLLSSGKARRMIVVLHRIAKHHRPFGLNEDYPSLVRKQLQDLGLKDSVFTIIVTPINNPVTLTSAKGVIAVLFREGVRSAILVSPGFHMRRSYLVYQYLSAPFNIKIYPIAAIGEYELSSWWNRDSGARDFFSELQKLVFYLARGYIPLKFSYN